MQQLRAHDDDADTPEYDPGDEPAHISPLPILLFDGHGGVLARAPVGAKEYQRDIDKRGAHDHTQRNQEGNLAKRVTGFEPTDGDEIRDHRPADEPSDERRDADARTDDHSGSERRRGQTNHAKE